MPTQRPETGLFATSGYEEAGSLRLKSQSSTLTPGNPWANGYRIDIYFSIHFSRTHWLDFFHFRETGRTTYWGIETTDSGNRPSAASR